MDKYDTYVQDERKHQDKLKTALETFALLKKDDDDDEIELINEEFRNLFDEIRCDYMDQGYVVDEIINHVRYS